MAVNLDGGCVVATLREGVHGDLLSLRAIDVSGHAALRNADAEEVLYVLEGTGLANGQPIAANSGIYLPPESTLTLEGTMTLVSVQCFDPATQQLSNPATQIVTLDAQPAHKTADRWYRELIQGQVTQFVGGIPPGRAPDHFHLYEEVLCILDGEGEMWAGASHAPIAKGSCIFLPRRQMHCVENRGSGELRLLGVFFPAGSPAVRYS
ncbi:MAG TPA: cupin domain-containing protein [Thermoanaerobaculia bacterium]|nr:cupin domain-containing protein [Thermoanaerobaculia bacterium]